MFLGIQHAAPIDFIHYNPGCSPSPSFALRLHILPSLTYNHEPIHFSRRVADHSPLYAGSDLSCLLHTMYLRHNCDSTGWMSLY